MRPTHWKERMRIYLTASAAGAVSASGEIRPTEFVRYELTLALTDGESDGAAGV